MDGGRLAIRRAWVDRRKESKKIAVLDIIGARSFESKVEKEVLKLYFLAVKQSEN